MPEIKIIPTIIHSETIGSNIKIITEYFGASSNQHLYQIFIADQVGNLSGVNYIEGEEIASFLSPLQITINSAGELIISDVYASQYYIDHQNGELFFVE